MFSAGLRLLFVASECQPLAKAGGLGDAVAALVKTLARRGHDARILLPRYASLDPVALGGRSQGTIRVPMGGETLDAELWRAPLEGGGTVYLLERDDLFAGGGVYGAGDAYARDAYRFSFLSRAALQLALDFDFVPDVLHAHDWPTALAPAYLQVLRAHEPRLARTGSVLTIHNVEYQGRFAIDAWRWIGLPDEQRTPDRFEDLGGLNFLKGGVAAADAITAVSPTYAREIRTEAGGHGLHPYFARRAASLTGILNGVDEELWDPRTDAFLAQRFDARDLRGKLGCKRALQAAFALEQRDDVPVLGIVSRLAQQKGLDLLPEPLAAVLDERRAQLVVQGSGDPALEETFRALAARFPGQAGVHVGYSEETAHRVHAGADFFLMPSRHEPCGLGQMYAMRYGTLPIVRATGGLADTVTAYDESTGDGTGFVFVAPTADACGAALRYAIDTWYRRPAHVARLRRQAMSRRFSWDDSAARLERVYASVIGARENESPPTGARGHDDAAAANGAAACDAAAASGAAGSMRRFG
jgi:starch synthase